MTWWGLTPIMDIFDGSECRHLSSAFALSSVLLIKACATTFMRRPLCVIMASTTLIEHFIRTRDNLLALSNHLQIATHGDVKGLAREALVSQFLSQNLPSLVDFKTGEIVDCKNEKSGQIDIILQSVTSPRIPLYNNIQISLADAVIAAIEVKSSLTTASLDNPSHLKSCLESFRKVKSLHRHYKLRSIHPSHNPHKNTPCILFAYSGPTTEVLIEKVVEYRKRENLDFDDFAPDLIVVIDRGYAIFRNDGWVAPKIEGDKPFSIRRTEKKSLIPLFVYLCKLIEVWNMDIKHTLFNEYLSED